MVSTGDEATGTLICKYVWMKVAPIAEGGLINFIRTDHIGRPVFVTNTGGTKVWTASYLIFGGVRTTTGTPITLGSARSALKTVPRTVLGARLIPMPMAPIRIRLAPKLDAGLRSDHGEVSLAQQPHDQFPAPVSPPANCAPGY